MLHIRLRKDDNKGVRLDALSVDKKFWYRIPEESSKLNQHAELLKKKSVKNSVDSIARIRHIQVRLSDELKEIYFDEDENLAFGGVVLDEEESKSAADPEGGESPDKRGDSYLLKRIADLELRNLQLAQEKEQIRFRDIEKALTIDKFSGKQNTAD